MITITFYQDSEGTLTGFDCRGHAGYSDGNDIVCSAVSALTINCINSVEALTDAVSFGSADESSADISFRLISTDNKDAGLLLRSLALGLQDIENSYENYIDLIFEEV